MKKPITTYQPSIGWEVTFNCNHKCFYCYNFSKINNIIGNYDYNKICDFIISKKPNSVGITGGEPLLVFEKIKPYIIKLRNNGIYVRINCNGSLITRDIAEFLKEYDIEVMVSFPSIKEDEFKKITSSDTYIDVISGINILNDYGVRILPNIVVSKINLNSIVETTDFLISNFNIKKVFISRTTIPKGYLKRFDDYLLNKEDFDFFFDTCIQLKKKVKIELSSCGGYPFCMFNSQEITDMFAKGCGIGKGGFVIDSLGNIRICSRDDVIYGNIFTEEYDSIMINMQKFNDENIIPKECSTCNVKKYCRGGCSINSKSRENSVYNIIDCDARLDRLPFKYSITKKVYYNPFKRRLISTPLNVVYDGIGNRISRRMPYIYLNNRMTKYLLNHKKVNILTIMALQKIGYRNACNIMQNLIRFEIVV